MSDQSQRTEKPTHRRIFKARREGQFISSRLLTGAIQFALATAFISSFAGGWSYRVAQVLYQLIRRAASGELDESKLIFLSRATLIETVVPLAFAGGGLLAIVLLSQLLVTQFGLAFTKMAPDIKKLNPTQKIQGMAKENLTGFFQGLVLIPLLLYIAFALFRDNLDTYLALPRMSAILGTRIVGGQIETMLWKAAGAFIVIGAIDYARQRHKYLKGLRMSKQEIKDEIKETEGNMESKGRIRRMMRAAHRRRMLAAVKTATAVVVNPTHYAVALRYDPGTSAAPIVVAKGKNHLALRIRAIATENYVPIIENPPLARGLYSSAEVGQEIPPHLYRAVAEILAHVFKLMSSYRP